MKFRTSMRSAADRAMERIAELQFGVVSYEQLLDCGHSKDTITYRIESGRLKTLHPRVHAIAGTPASWHRDQMAACLWSDGAASHRAAGFLWNLPGCDDPPLETTTTDIRITPRCGILVHHTLRMPADQLTKLNGIPATTVERTLLDLGAVFSSSRVAMALDDALRRGLTTIGDLDFCLYLTARRGRRGCAVLRRLVHQRWDLEAFPESPLETLIFQLLEASSLPMPELQYEIDHPLLSRSRRPDFLFPQWKLIVEGHSRKWHSGEFASSRDAVRHRELTGLGFRILYITWADVVLNPEGTLRRIEMALKETGWIPSLDSDPRTASG